MIGDSFADTSTMCHETECSSCGKRTWAGCGFHKEGVIAGIDPENVCLE